MTPRDWPRFLPAPLPLGLWACTRALLLISLLGPVHDIFLAQALSWSQPLLHGHLSQVRQIYPFLAMVLLAIPAIGHVSLSTYEITFPVMIIAFDFVGLLFARRAERSGHRYATLVYILLIPLIGPVLLLWRFDLVPAVCQLGALVCLMRGRRGWSWLLLGLGIALKLYLAILLPIWLVFELRTGSKTLRRFMVGAALVALPTLVALSLALPSGTLKAPYRDVTARSATVDSTPGLVMAELNRHGVHEPTISSPSCDCWIRVGAGSSVVGNIGLGVEVIGSLIVAGLLWRRPSIDAVIRGSVALVIIVLLASPVISPQFLVWPLPALSLVASRPMGRLAVALGAGAALLTWYEYPNHFVHVVRFDAVGQAVLFLRIACLVGAVVALALDRGWVTNQVPQRAAPTRRASGA